MRPGQQQNRRGRNNRHQGGGGGGGQHGHRKQQNPLARSWESNGPDVKVRGTPHHIAEKYMMLARDAQSSGDPVLAENYLQHAEHYNRIIMAYSEQAGQGAEGGQPFRYRQPGAPMEPGEAGEDMGGDDQPNMDDARGGGEQPPSAAASGDAPQQGERPPFQDRGDRQDRYNRQDGQGQGAQGQGGGHFRDRDRNFDGQDRQFRRDRDRDPGGQRFNDRGDRGNRPYQNGEQRRDRFNNDRGGFENRGERGEQGGERRFDRNDRGDRDRPGFRPEQRYDRDRGERFGGERSERPPQDRPQHDRGDRPEGQQATGHVGGQSGGHERYVPDRRPQRTFSPTQSEQPAPEWIAPVPAAVEVPVSRAVEPVVPTRVADAPVSAAAAPVVDAPAAVPRGRRKPAAPAAPVSGERFREDDQPSFLRRPTRRTKTEAKPGGDVPSDSKPE